MAATKTRRVLQEQQKVTECVSQWASKQTSEWVATLKTISTAREFKKQKEEEKEKKTTELGMQFGGFFEGKAWKCTKWC